ncbi:hypothetical protein ACHAWF_007787 [Thalassiosira exigua]
MLGVHSSPYGRHQHGSGGAYGARGSGYGARSSGHQTQRQRNSRSKSTNKRRVRFTDTGVKRHEYEFDWEFETDYWFTKVELKTFNENRFDDADVLRKERGIRTKSRDDADTLSTSRRDKFIHDKLTHSLDDEKDNHDISLGGIEHFVFPVLQKEMVRRKKELKALVVATSRDPQTRRQDPQGLKLAAKSASLSKWARDNATERGIKQCQMKRGKGRGGGLLRMTHEDKNMSRGRRRFSKIPSFRDEQL